MIQITYQFHSKFTGILSAEGMSKRLIVFCRNANEGGISEVPAIEFVQLPHPRGGVPMMYALQESTKVR